MGPRKAKGLRAFKPITIRSEDMAEVHQPMGAAAEIRIMLAAAAEQTVTTATAGPDKALCRIRQSPGRSIRDIPRMVTNLQIPLAEVAVAIPIQQMTKMPIPLVRETLHGEAITEGKLEDWAAVRLQMIPLVRSLWAAEVAPAIKTTMPAAPEEMEAA
jgi:hypothetical protein